MKEWLKKYLPDPETIQQKKSLRWLSTLLKNRPYLWSLNRRTVAKGVASGLLVAFLPLPGQTVLAILLAFLFRANLPIAIATTFISNPFTFIPINFLIYKIGTFITQSNGSQMPTINALEFHWQSLALFWQETWQWIQSLGKNYFIGLAVVSISSSVMGYVLVDIIWRISVWWQLRRREKKRS